MPAFNLLFAELVECKKRQQVEDTTLPNTLLVSATPHPIFVTELLQIPERDIEGILSFNNSKYKIEFAEYDELPEETASHIQTWAEDGLVNFVGGCCGTTPDHIQSIAEAVAGFPPREPPILQQCLRLSGLEAIEVV